MLFAVHSSSVSSKAIQVLNLSQAFAFLALYFCTILREDFGIFECVLEQRVINCFYLLNTLPHPQKSISKEQLLLILKRKKLF